MNVTSWITLACALPVLVGVAWQIRRDFRKDRAEQERGAIDEAVRDALIERRLREIEERARDERE